MKLLLQILRYQLVTSMIVLFLGAGLFYVSVRYLIDREANKELFQSQVKVRWQLKHLETLPVYILQLGDSLQLEPVRYPGRSFIRETSMLNLAENEFHISGEKPTRNGFRRLTLSYLTPHRTSPRSGKLTRRYSFPDLINFFTTVFTTFCRV